MLIESTRSQHIGNLDFATIDQESDAVEAGGAVETDGEACFEGGTARPRAAAPMGPGRQRHPPNVQSAERAGLCPDFISAPPKEMRRRRLAGQGNDAAGTRGIESARNGRTRCAALKRGRSPRFLVQLRGEPKHRLASLSETLKWFRNRVATTLKSFLMCEREFERHDAIDARPRTRHNRRWDADLANSCQSGYKHDSHAFARFRPMAPRSTATIQRWSD